MFIRNPRFWRLFLGFAVALALFASIALGLWLLKLDQNIKTRFAEKRFAPPVEFYSAPESVMAGMHFPEGFFDSAFARKNFRRRDFGQPIQAGDYSLWSGEQCASLGLAPPAAEPPPPPLKRCIAYRSVLPGPEGNEAQVQIIALDETGAVAGVFEGAPPQAVPQVELEPELFAQYYGDKPVLRKIVGLGGVPTQCLNGLLAIEDAKFLEHPGVSVSGLLRALLSAVTPGKRAVGGSTITQQLVKNYFLTDERTVKRKAIEFAMAILVERHASKDEILETYINLIYMGQNGPFQVRGFAAASDHYFGKPLSDLNLEECALLSGLLNNPGKFNPFTGPENALKRRARVLEKMVEQKVISPEEGERAKNAALPQKPSRGMTEPAPYFVQTVRKDLAAREIEETDGLRVYTTLNLRAQEAAHQAIRQGLDKLESSTPLLKKLKAQGKSLEASLIAADPRTGAIQALVGGRGYLLTQFNRAVESHRQVGSVMKPFVYLTAFESATVDGKPYTPLTQINDRATTHKYQGQTWTPHNYEASYAGDVPIFWSLKESLNAATANLGMQVGLDNVIDTARRLGVVSKIEAFPSLTLGAFELTPIEVLQAYCGIAGLGKKTQLTLVHRVEGLGGNILYRYQPDPVAVVAPEPVAELVGVMKQTLINGTGRAARLAGFTHPAAGKTGTTNDKKDAWFAGFTPLHAAIVWVGYDDNTSHNLTGGSGAVPIWTAYMKSYASALPPVDFPWPETVERFQVTPEEQLAAGVPAKAADKLETIELIRRK